MIDVVGIGADGWPSVPASARPVVLDAEVVLGAPRQLALLDEAGVRAAAGQQRRSWPSPLLPALPDLLAELGSRRVAVLASGDPLVSGVGSTLIRLLGAANVRVHPAVSSIALARARLGWAQESCESVSLVSAPVTTLRRWLVPGARLLLLSAGARTPGEVAGLLREHGWRDARLVVLGDLGTESETRQDSCGPEFDLSHVPALSVVAVELGAHPGLGFALGTGPGLPDEAFEHDGQLTKWELRIAALARLRPVAGQLLWDLGAGAGSIGIEWARHHPRCRTVAVERDEVRASRIVRNAEALGVATGVRVVTGASADALDDLPDPNAVFIGGGASQELLHRAWHRLPAGGRLVVHAVTLETEAVLVAAHTRWGGDLRRLTVERAEQLGTRFRSWTPARPVVQWAGVKPADPEAAELEPTEPEVAEPGPAEPDVAEPGPAEPGPTQNPGGTA